MGCDAKRFARSGNHSSNLYTKPRLQKLQLPDMGKAGTKGRWVSGIAEKRVRRVRLMGTK